MEFLENFPDQNFVSGGYFMWSPASKTVTYDIDRLPEENGRIALLHELGHARLGHTMYKYDMELLGMEMEAWDVVRELAPSYGLTVDEEHIADCISTYDTWLSKRATCPDCNNFSLQSGRDAYACFACGSKWQVNWRKDRRVHRTIISRYNSALVRP